MDRAKWIRRLGVVMAAAAVLPALGCGRRGHAQAREPGPVRVVVSIPPLAGLVESLVPDGSEVLVLVGAGRSPHGYEPRPSDLAAIGRADLVVLVGMGVESSLPQSMRAGERVLVMAEALGLGGGVADEHAGHVSAHAEGDADPHLWLDPVLVEEFVPVLAARVRDAALAAGLAAPAAESVREREAALLGRVRAVDGEYRQQLEPYAGAAIITQHAAWSRLAARYGLKVVGVIQLAEDVEPSPGHVAEVIAAGKEYRVTAVFAEAQLDARIAERIAGQVDAPVGTLDPLGQGDWEAMMRANRDTMVLVMGSGDE